MSLINQFVLCVYYFFHPHRICDPVYPFTYCMIDWLCNVRWAAFYLNDTKNTNYTLEYCMVTVPGAQSTEVCSTSPGSGYRISGHQQESLTVYHSECQIISRKVLTIFQLYRGSQFYCWSKSEYLKKTTVLSKVTSKFYHIMLYRVHLVRSSIRTHNLIGYRQWLQMWL